MVFVFGNSVELKDQLLTNKNKVNGIEPGSVLVTQSSQEIETVIFLV